MTGNFKLIYYDNMGKRITENFGKIKADNLYSTDDEVKMAFATEIDTFSRGIAYLTTNTYSDSEIQINVSINEVLNS